MPRPRRRIDAAVVVLLAGVAAGLGLALHRLAVDDAFITFRYAQNLARGQGFAYNPGSPVLSTTAPLYALLLSAGTLLGAPIPGLANAVSAFATWAGAMLLYRLVRQEGGRPAGALAGLLLAASPLLWLGLGLETSLFLALSLGALVAYRGDRLCAAAALLALATLTRGDGLILGAVLGADYALRHLRHREARSLRPGHSPVRRALAAAGVFLAVALPLLAWLTWQFGLPLPATLAAKRAQSALGVTGFYAHTTYPEGLWILIRARLEQSPLYILIAPALVAGLWAVVRQRCQGARLIVAWAAAHLAGYTALGVTPYTWYYAPLLPALACLAALGVAQAAGWLGRLLDRRRQAHVRGGRQDQGLTSVLAGLWAAGLLIGPAISDAAMIRALIGPVPAPEDPVSRVLPEAKVDAYRQVGEWLKANTPSGSLVGVTEVGVMGFYAERPMVDFLGLLEPAVAEALSRGDLYWALLIYQPDFLVLTAVSPLYAYDLRADPWFQAAYAPVQTFEDARFWGSPLTVYRRQVARMPVGQVADSTLPPEATRLDADLGPVRLLGAWTGQAVARPGEIVPLTLYWQALEAVPQDYVVFVHLLGQHDRVIAQRDAAPGLGARPTSGWVPGQIVVDPYLLALPEAAYAPDRALWEVGLYQAASGQRLSTADGRDNVRFGAISVEPAATPLRLEFGPVALTGYSLDRLALTQGEALTVTLFWEPAAEGSRPVEVEVRLTGESGESVALESRPLNPAGGGSMVICLISTPPLAPGAYDLGVAVSDPATGKALPLLGADGQPRGDRARLTKVRVYP